MTLSLTFLYISLWSLFIGLAIVLYNGEGRNMRKLKLPLVLGIYSYILYMTAIILDAFHL